MLCNISQVMNCITIPNVILTNSEWNHVDSFLAILKRLFSKRFVVWQYLS